jgi:hypothetical protein
VAYSALKFESQLSTVSEPLESDMNERAKNSVTMESETMGSPLEVVLARIRGAYPRRESPYSIRDAEYMSELPAEKAEVRIAALMILGRALMPARLKAMTNGDEAAVPVDCRRDGSVYGTRRPTTKTARM